MIIRIIILIIRKEYNKTYLQIQPKMRETNNSNEYNNNNKEINAIINTRKRTNSEDNVNINKRKIYNNKNNNNIDDNNNNINDNNINDNNNNNNNNNDNNDNDNTRDDIRKYISFMPNLVPELSLNDVRLGLGLRLMLELTYILYAEFSSRTVIK